MSIQNHCQTLQKPSTVKQGSLVQKKNSAFTTLLSILSLPLIAFLTHVPANPNDPRI